MRDCSTSLSKCVDPDLTIIPRSQHARPQPRLRIRPHKQERHRYSTLNCTLAVLEPMYSQVRLQLGSKLAPRALMVRTCIHGALATAKSQCVHSMRLCVCTPVCCKCLSVVCMFVCRSVYLLIFLVCLCVCACVSSDHFTE